MNTIQAKTLETEAGYDRILKTFEKSADVVKDFFNSMDPDGEFDFPDDLYDSVPDIMDDYAMPELGIHLHPVVDINMDPLESDQDFLNAVSGLLSNVPDIKMVNPDWRGLFIPSYEIRTEYNNKLKTVSRFLIIRCYWHIRTGLWA